MAKVEGGGEKVDTAVADADLMCDSRVFFPMNVMAQKAGVKKGVDFQPLCMHAMAAYGVSFGLTDNHLPLSSSVDKS